MRAACRAVREAAQGTAISATMRTARDGGAGDADAARYEALLVMLARERLCDALDVELSVGEAAFSRIARAAHAGGHAGDRLVSTTLRGTPDDGRDGRAALHEWRRWARTYARFAVMPRESGGTLSRLTAACAQADDALTQPIIAISMGRWARPREYARRRWAAA